MGSGVSVNEDFLNSDYRKRLEVTLATEIERHGIAKEQAAEIVNKVVEEGEKMSSSKEANEGDPDAPAIRAVTKKCPSELNIPIIRGANMFVCSVDGTEAGDLAFSAVKALVKKKDHICMFHAYNQPTAETRVAMRPDNIKERYANELLGTYGPSRYSFIWEDKGDSNVKEVISKLSTMYAQLASGATPDFLVMGYTGSRGITKKEGATTAGSVSNFAMRNIRMPIIIVKTEVPMGPKSFVMAVDKSTTSITGLEILYTLIKPQDTLTVIHVAEVRLDKLGNNTIDVLAEQYEKDLAESAPTTNVSFQTLLSQDGKNTAEVIQDKVKELGPDFFALAPRTNPDNMLTALTEQMIVNVRSNIILCKL